jgi:PPOX class probable F420-dependent enzyme
MMDERLQHLLEERRIATLTTFSPDGLPHVTAVWFLYEDGALYIATGSNTGKGRNLQRDARLALCIESREPGREAGLSACGHAELLQGEEAAPYALRVNAKYLTEAALEHPKVGPFFVDMSDLVIRLKPERWISWDMAALGDQLFGAEVDEAEFFKPLLI